VNKSSFLTKIQHTKHLPGGNSVPSHVSPYSYDVQMPDGNTRHFHANKIKKFIAKVQFVGVVNKQNKDFGLIECVTMPNQINEPSLPSQRINPQQLEHLSPEQCTRLLAVLDEFADCFTDTPRHYEIRVSDGF